MSSTFIMNTPSQPSINIFEILFSQIGFGALIRAMGMKTNKNRNKDACRDLSGRRLRHVNAEKK